MLDTKEQIRTALIEIAEELRRPHYEPLTVREVLASFDNNTHHPLKEAVLRKVPFLNIKKSISVTEEPKEKIKKPARKIQPAEIIKPINDHGTLSKYSEGCRCDECGVWA